MLASLVRDHGDLAKVSEARIRREIVERSKLWQERVWAQADSPADTLSEFLKRFDIDQRALLWLEHQAGLSVVELAWILGVEPHAIRGAQDALEQSIEGGRSAASPAFRDAIEAAPTDELLSRLADAKAEAGVRNRRRTVTALGFLAFFFLMMAIVFLSLMNWQGDTLPEPTPIDPPVETAP